MPTSTSLPLTKEYAFSSGFDATEKDVAAVFQPLIYLESNPGKGTRSLMINALNVWLNVLPDQLESIIKVVDLLHHGSLLIDDIQDSSELRRGKPCAHLIFGVPLTIAAAHGSLGCASQELHSLEHRHPYLRDKHISLIMTEEIQRLTFGQGLDIFWRDNFQCPTEEEYIKMIKNSSLETGSLFRDFVRLGDIMSVYFQIRDDYMNLTSSEYTNAKGFAEDLTEGKFSFPVIHSINADKSNKLVLEALESRPKTPTQKRRTLDYITNETKSLEYTRKVMSDLEGELRFEIGLLGDSLAFEDMVERLHVIHT
ncbi:hypothetical protein Clacol_000932 [Clathrus columnatus]|uniref:(2E,6E)-farnesyl diphosphate synthase n=1 Tax=Clathrus columnatus TaxID=1419009 RepID=A0AAV4ZXD5_9AGAM|nr:hypothetical protein Clacol_000932 [Clathrus columnatus]